MSTSPDQNPEPASAGGRRPGVESFLSRVSREIRTPLNAIVGLSHVLRAELAGSPAAARVGQLQDSAHDLLSVMTDVLDLLRIEAGEFELASEEFALDTLLTRVCASVADEADAKGLELVVHAAHMPGAFRGDAARLSHALLHLLRNAIQNADDGAVTLVVSEQPAEAGYADVRFEVHDTGAGLEPAHADRINERSDERAAPSPRHYDGQGLGLAITGRLAQLMGGDVGVRSERGHGSTFWLTARLASVRGSEHPKLDGPLRGRRVLLVDDLPDAREAIGALLGVLGVSADCAGSGEEALAMAVAADDEGRPYEVVLLDRLMPGMDGYATAQALTDHAGASPPTLVLISGMVDETVMADARRLDIEHVLVKPLGFAALHGLLLRLLPERAQAAGAEAQPVAARGASARVLLAEDHALNRRVAEALLRHAGLEVELAADGLEAVALATSRPFDVVLMDVQMPGIDGIEATRRIRAEPGLGRLPIIAMTANAFADDRAACLAAGMDAHIAKPVDPETLYAMLSHWLGVPVSAPRPADDGAELHVLAAAAGLATDRGLRAFGNDAATYRSALAQFATMYARGLPGGAADASRPREVHALVGASATIGALALQSLASRLDARLREGAPGAEVEALTAQVEQELARLCERLSARA